jgi:hypothetical protein
MVLLLPLLLPPLLLFLLLLLLRLLQQQNVFLVSRLIPVVKVLAPCCVPMAAVDCEREGGR